MAAVLVGVASFLLFLLFQAQGIPGGDSGDLVTAAATFGVPHPPGYPLYTFLGWLLAKLPLSTIVWRVGLLSSISHAVTVSLVYLLVFWLTKKRIAGLFAAATLAGNYLFFLYSVTPEVFALFDLFVIALTVLVFQWRKTRDARYLLSASFVFGLSLSHHHVILFLVPALAFFVWKEIKNLRHSFIGLLGCWIIGLVPYLYLPIAGSGSSIINWNRPDTLDNFFKLVTRADYGSFVSGGFYGSLLSQRLVQVKAYLQFLFLDQTAIGVVLTGFGMLWLWKRDREFFWFFVIALLFLGPLFFFYASFPLVNRFTLGTYERFLLPSYVLISVAVGLGYAQVVKAVKVLTRRWKRNLQPGFLVSGVALVLAVYPVSILGMTIWRFWGISADRTAQHLGEDIMASVPAGSILLLQRDTPLFTTQYVRYGMGFRPDVMVLHASRFATPDYPAVIARVFPTLSVPPVRGDTFFDAFLRENRDRFPITSNVPLSGQEGWVWVQQGLVYRFLPQRSAPTIEALEETNNRLWQEYHDPTAGILSRYPHLVLSDVLEVYEASRIEWGKALLRAGLLERAKEQFQRALQYGGDTQTAHAWTLLGVTELFLKECDDAIVSFAKVRETISVEAELPVYEAVTWRDCRGDEDRARKLFDEYERLQKSRETPLAP